MVVTSCWRLCRCIYALLSPASLTELPTSLPSGGNNYPLFSHTATRCAGRHSPGRPCRPRPFL